MFSSLRGPKRVVHICNLLNWNRCSSSVLEADISRITSHSMPHESTTGRHSGAAALLARWLHGSRLADAKTINIIQTGHQTSSLTNRSQLFSRQLSSRSNLAMEIGARSRARQQKRLLSLALGGTAVAGCVILLLNTFQENIMFYITPTQALEKFAGEPTRNRFRLGGLVLEGSVRRFANSTEMEFVVTDLANDILVRYRGSLPDLFREGHSVVAEGFLKPLEAVEGDTLEEDEKHDVMQKAKTLGCYFAAAEVLAKHDEKYMPKEVAAAVERNKATIAEGVKSNEVVEPVTGPSPASIKQSSRPSKLSKVAQAPTQVQEYEL